jgi:outer membrane protein OmpA-like peptidoglycan-associated protein
MIPFRRHQNTAATRTGGGPTRGWARAEGEADRVADAVLDRDSRDSGHRPHADVPQAGAAALPGVGQPLDPARRAFFEQRLGADLSGVRVHAGAAADRAARDEHAYAYTFGEHVVLGDDAGDATLAHELVHVLQQRQAGHTAVQREERASTGGIGATPPKVKFDFVSEQPAGEDMRVLFQHDSASLAGFDPKSVLARLPSNRPLVVDVDGYASSEGDTDYNVNLSAHRAAVLRTILLPLLPEGSIVQLHAHGATAVFGDPAANRRVGIRFAEAQVPLVPPLGTGAFGRDRRLERLLPDLHLHLDPGLSRFAPPETVLPTPDLRLGERSEPKAPVAPFRVPLLPAEPVRPIELFPRLLPPKTLVEWTDMRQVFTDHGAGPIDQRMFDAIETFAKDWFQRYRELGLTDDQARWLVNFGTRKAIAVELTRDGNTPVDRSDNELSREGKPTPIIIPLSIHF